MSIQLSDFEIFDRSTPGAVPKQAAFISFERSGTINFSVGFVEQKKLTDETGVSFARVRATWYVAFDKIAEREQLQLRCKYPGQQNKSLLTTHSITTTAVRDTPGLSTKLKTSVRLRLANKPAFEANGVQWLQLEPLSTEALPPAPVAPPPAAPVVEVAPPPAAEKRPTLPQFDITHGSDKRVGNVSVASIKTLKGRHAYLSAQKELTSDEAKELGQIDRRLQRELSEADMVTA